MKSYQNKRNTPAFLSESPDWNQAILQDRNTKPTILSKELVSNYLAAWYQIRIDTTRLIMLRIGSQSRSVATLLQATGNQNAAYITACNPASQMVTPEENQSATIQLYKQLAGYSKHLYPGESIDPAGEWPAEAGFLALGIDLATARTIGHAFGQNAIIWMNTDAISRLVLLR